MNSTLILLLIADIEEIKRLKETKGEPFAKSKYRKLKQELLKYMEGEKMKVGEYILVKGYANKNPDKPYIQIYTKETLEARNQYYSHELL